MAFGILDATCEYLFTSDSMPECYVRNLKTLDLDRGRAEKNCFVFNETKLIYPLTVPSVISKLDHHDNSWAGFSTKPYIQHSGVEGTYLINNTFYERCVKTRGICTGSCHRKVGTRQRGVAEPDRGHNLY